jgi:uncharacterized phage protein gp47/JayE
MSDQQWYIEVDLTTSEQEMADNAVEALQERWEDWEPNEGDMEVVQIEALSGVAAPVAQQASVGTEEIFRTFGTRLAGVPYQAGTPAQTTVTFTLIDDLEHLIESGTEIDIDGVTFETLNDALSPLGQTVVPNVLVQATVDGVQGDGLGNVVSKVSSLSFVTDITADAPTSGGVDAQSDVDYLSFLARKLQLRADTVVTKRDHELWALDWPGVGRAFALHTDDRHVTVFIADAYGEALTAAIKDAMEAAILDFRLVNTITDFVDPSYTTVSVTYQVKALPGFDFADLEARIDDALASYLSPTGFAAPKSGDPGVIAGNWVGTNVVRRNVLIDRIGDVEGVDYVDTITLALPSGGGAVNGVGDVVMTGTVALPRLGVVNGTII